MGCSLQMLAALYQNFVVSGFGVEGDQLKRYEEGQRKLAGILGLEDKVKMKVSTVYWKERWGCGRVPMFSML